MSVTAAAKNKASRTKGLTPKTTEKKATKQPSAATKRASNARAPLKKTPAVNKPATAPEITPAELSHRLHLLLHSIHQIERYEERLCSITDAIKRTGRLNAGLRHDLQTLIEELPSDEFLHDLDAVRSAVLP